MDSLISRIVATPDVFYKHLKFDEDELTNDEKVSILRNLIENNISLFLTRYGKYLSSDDCSLFNSSDDPFVEFLLKNLKDSRPRNTKNERYVMMQSLIENGDYFSDIKMRQREPYLFDAMIGRFLNESERLSLRPTVTRNAGEGCWSAMLDRFEESGEIAQRRNMQEYEYTKDKNNKSDRLLAHVSNRLNHDDFVPEEDEAEDDDDEIEKLRKEMERLSQLEADQYNQDLDEIETPLFLRKEFENFMKQRFLAGKDKEFFDYSKCENSKNIDKIRERDEEEKWFDDE